MYTFAEIADMIAPRSSINDQREINHLLIDSRRLLFPEQTLFFALKGPRNNGHEFIEDLYERGVRAFVVSNPLDYSLFPEASFLVVKDTLWALQKLAAAHRKKFHIPVIGITGSNGKTIVKEWLYQLLNPDFSIVRSPKSYNSQIGVPLSIWPMHESHQLGIFEAGISQAGEMDRLQPMISPTIGIFTNIGEAHSEGFLNIRQKVNEKLKLFLQAELIIYSKDDIEVHEAVANLWQQLRKNGTIPFKIIHWSFNSEADLQVLNCYKESGQTTLTAHWQGKTLQIKIPFTDAASIENAIHCWCVMLHFGITPEKIAERMLRLASVAMRLELKQGLHQCSVINDSYSADVNSLMIALDFMMQQGKQPRKTVILSDILQSGKTEHSLYQEVANALHQRAVQRFIGIGRQISSHKELFELIPGMESSFYERTENFLLDFKRFNFKEETILLKGARVFEFERISQLMELQQHQTVLEINLNTLVHNLKLYQQKIQSGTKVMAMVKAFAYGSGGYEIASVLQYHKVDYLAVAYADEGVSLRAAGIHMPIMVMNPEPATFENLLQYTLEPVVYSLSSMRALKGYLNSQGIQQFPIHIELETGMNRLGMTATDLLELESFLVNNTFKVQSIFTHLVGSEDPQLDHFTQSQIGLYASMVAKIKKYLTYPFLQHVANTTGISRHSSFKMDMVRLGIGLYGVDSNMDGLEEVSSLKTTIAQLKHLNKGDTVGYGRRGQVERDSVIATVRIGYADGYPRSLSGGNGKMLVHGQWAPVMGSVCMDMTMIDVTDIPQVKEGDSVIVFGKGLSVATVAQWAGTIPYEILTGVSQRVKRVYFEE